jgi:hypothetical protein
MNFLKEKLLSDSIFREPFPYLCGRVEHYSVRFFISLLTHFNLKKKNQFKVFKSLY